VVGADVIALDDRIVDALTIVCADIYAGSAIAGNQITQPRQFAANVVLSSIAIAVADDQDAVPTAGARGDRAGRIGADEVAGDRIAAAVTDVNAGLVPMVDYQPANSRTVRTVFQ